MFKYVADVISPIISKLINTFIKLGISPSIFKVARVIPIHKSGSKYLLENHRPISTFHFLSKVITDKFEILSHVQFGFRKAKSTSDAILTFTQNCYSAVNDRNFLMSVFLDFNKSFIYIHIYIYIYTADHSKLLKNIYRYGFRGHIHSWFKSYLEGRHLFVDISGCFSGKLPISTRVPKGNILGPMLFIIYINNFWKCSDVFNFIHFADDSTIYVCGENLNDLTRTVNRELEKVKGWIRANRLSLNIRKTSFMIFSNKQFEIPEIMIRNESLSCVEKMEFLGVVIVSKLKFIEHISNVCNKISKLSFIFKAGFTLGSTTWLVRRASSAWAARDAHNCPHSFNIFTRASLLNYHLDTRTNGY